MINPENSKNQRVTVNPQEEFLSYSEHMRQIAESKDDISKPTTEIITYNSALEHSDNESFRTRIDA